MADQKLSIIVSVIDKFSKGFSDLESKLKKNQDTFKTMAKAGSIAFAGITAAIGLSIREAGKAETAQVRLAQILKNTNNASQEQIDVLLNQADALEKVGVVSGEAINIAQGTLATFDLQTDSIEKLIPAFLNMAVAEKGVNVTTDDMIGLANGLGKVLQGQVGALSRQGFVFDEVTAKILKNGTETEKITALTKILNSTYDGMNETMRKTTAGGMVGLQMSFGKLTENIGKAFIPVLNKVVDALIPVIDKMTKWADENPKLVSAIAGVALVIAGLVAVIGTLGIVIIPLKAGLAGLGIAFAIAKSAVFGLSTALTFLAANPIVLVIAAIAALVAGLIWLWKNSEQVNQYISASLQVLADFFIGIWETIKQTFIDNWNAIAEFFAEIWTAITEPFIVGLNFISNLWTIVWTNASLLFTTVWEAMKAGGTAAIDWFVALFGAAVDKIGAAFGAIWEGAKGVMLGIFESIKGAIVSVLNWIIEKMNALISKFNSLVIGGINKLPGVELKEMPKIPLLAEGGIVTRPTLAMIGEGGEPEAVIPLSKMNQGRSIIINISGNTLLDERAGAKIGDMIIKKLRPNASF